MKTMRANGGYTLYEVLGYSLILGMLLSLSTSIFLSSKRISFLGTLALERNDIIEEVVHDFRAVAAQSIGVAPSIPQVSLPADTVVLELRSAGGEPHFALWRTDADNRLYLQKYSAREGQPVQLAYRKVYAPALRVTEFAVNVEGRLVRLQFAADTEYTPRTVPRHNTAVAVLGER